MSRIMVRHAITTTVINMKAYTYGYVNNCTDPNGGWALGCRIDGGKAEYVRVPYADQGLNRIPDSMSDNRALLVGFTLSQIEEAYRLFENKEDGIIKVAITNE